MSRKKRSSSKVIQRAATRAAALESLNPTADIGGEITLEVFKGAIAHTQEKQAAYNTLLSQADEAKNAFEKAERKARDLSERMLAAVAAKFGRDSIEYEKAGGRRRSNIKRSPRLVEEPVTKAA